MKLRSSDTGRKYAASRCPRVMTRAETAQTIRSATMPPVRISRFFCAVTKSPAQMGFCMQSIPYGRTDCKESGLSSENGDSCKLPVGSRRCRSFSILCFGQAVLDQHRAGCGDVPKKHRNEQNRRRSPKAFLVFENPRRQRIFFAFAAGQRRFRE